MDRHTLVILFGLLLNSQIALAVLWRCTQDADCDSRSGSVCDVATGACVCAPGQQTVLGGSACVDMSPYLTSACVEDHQCSRLFTAFQCRRVNETTVGGNCFCSPGHHYHRGRCWRNVDFGGACARDEECMGVIQNPFSMSCKGTCRCADGYSERQRGDCRKIGLAVGDGCVLDEDCQFPEGVCDMSTLRCISNDTESISQPLVNVPAKKEPHTQMAPPLNMRVPWVVCNATTPCDEPFECSTFGVCVCPVGYYSTDGLRCLAELGSPAVSDQCVGLLAVIVDGICTCPPNMFFEESMRDCIRATRRISDSCVADTNCHTFGPASRCGPPQEPWGFRSCECIPEYAVWDPRLNFCRFFSGPGGTCETDSDCQAGELEIVCVKNEDGQGICSCPDGLEEFEGLCLTTGLELGARCQHTRECSGTANTVCDPRSQLCSCTEGYQPNDGVCSPIIGGTCAQDADCVIEHTECRNSTCECKETFLTYEDACWPEVSGYNSTCSITPQCVHALGESSVCDNSHCVCARGHHFRDGNCWRSTRLMEPCSRISQCYLPSATDKVVCRNGLCQCDFHFAFSEELQTCLPTSAANSMGHLLLLLIATFTITLLCR
ncbi:multiple epidermal growth factor-like domains protein 10 [Maniola jurtina]|uniref:multiple epidermal growth factor-like domains protein 10 n=1 Tax=Maniola jurtina TaxID=191418 RepID=UPI001E686B32|nr:multiple epidermal growth factor-like domains protein 10 [Maniola jurtina]